MENNTAPSRHTGRMITKNLIILLVLAVVAFLAIWAWFTSRQTVQAGGINIECNAPDGVEIAVVAPGETPEEADYKDGGIIIKDQQFLEDFSLSEVTSDGINFYKPALVQSNGTASPDLDADWDVAVANENYLSFDLYIRSKSSQIVSLSTKSKFSPLSSVLTGANCGNKSEYGDFSKDCIVGASRFSVVNSDSTARELLWIPRPDLYFSSEGTPSVTENVTADQYDGITYNHYYYEVNGSQKTLKTLDSSLVTTSALIGSEYVLPKKSEIARLSIRGDDGYYTNHVTCNMWIEGEDTEDRLALVKGQFKIVLDLTIK